MVLDIFLAAAAVLWLSLFGYPLALVALARFRRRPPASDSPLPPIAVVVPTLNEEALVAGKLADLARTEYPADRLTVLVVDGGSADRTCDVVERECERHLAVRLCRLGRSAGQADQVGQALAMLPHEIVVITDADARLEPGCVRALVRELLADPALAVAGAVVRPRSRLLEERVYSWALTRLWWLEGEALSSAMVSGACYAVRRAAVPSGCRKARALDVSLAAGAAARGMSSRLCRGARATELRVPQNAGEFVRFRRRRGRGYLDEIRPFPGRKAPLRWHVARLMRLWQLLVVPRIAAGLAAVAAVLLLTPSWTWPAGALAAFAASALVWLAASGAGEERPSWWRVGLAAVRLSGLLWLALLAIGPARPLVSARPLQPEQTA